MLGLIKKDLLMIKQNLKTLIIILVAFALMSLQGNSNLSYVAVLTSVMIFITTFSWDEYNNFHAYAITFPKGKENIVKAKYLASLLILFVTIVITALANIAIGYYKHNLDWDYIISMSAGCIFACILIQSIVFPLMFKFGVEKGRIGLFVLAFGFSSLVTIIASTGVIELPDSLIATLETYLPAIITIISTILILTSYLISKRIVSKKEY